MSKKQAKKAVAEGANFVAAGLNFHRNGDLRGAQACYRRALAIDPQCSDAYHLLGVSAMQEGDPATAETAIRQAIRINRRVHWYYNNLGLALKNQGRPDAAAEAFKEALRLQPLYAEAHLNRGLVQEEQGELEAALASYEEAVRINGRYREARFALGNLLEKLGRHPLAAAAYSAAIAAGPNDVDAKFALAGLRLKQRNPVEALGLYREILAVQPGNAPALNNLGEVLRQVGQFDDAEAAFRAAIACRPANAAYHSNLASVCNALGRTDEAIAACQQALAIDPRHEGACINWGNALRLSGRLSEAAAVFQRAIEIAPRCSAALSNEAGVQRDLGNIDKALDSYRAALLAAPDDPLVFSNYLLCLLYAEDSTRATIYAEHRRFQGMFAGPPGPAKPGVPSPDPARKLRVGFMSADLREHSVSCFLESIFRHYDRQRMEFFCFSLSPLEDAISERLKGLCEGWIGCADLSGDPLALADRLEAEHMDVLVELGGHTAGNALLALARRPAPVQVSYLGYPETTGFDGLDYRLTDAFADPDGVADKYSSERLLRLPHSYFCYTPPADAPEVADCPFDTNGHIVFGSFNNSAKINPRLLGLWAEVLLEVPASRLLLKARTYNDPDARRTLLSTFESLGVSPERVLFAGYARTRREHLETYGQVDIGLDSYPYNGATTTCEALWMGVPVVSLAGERHSSRMGLSILSAAGLAEWVASDHSGYIRRCIDLANRPEYRQDLRRHMRARLSETPLLQGEAFALHFEIRLREAWLAAATAGTPTA